jgi:hypothetical protein
MDGSSPTYPPYLCVERPGRDWQGLYHGRNPALWSTTATANTSKPLRPHSPAQVRVGRALIVGCLRMENVTRMSSCEVYVGVPVVSLLKMKRDVFQHILLSATHYCRLRRMRSQVCGLFDALRPAQDLVCLEYQRCQHVHRGSRRAVRRALLSGTLPQVGPPPATICGGRRALQVRVNAPTREGCSQCSSIMLRGFSSQSIFKRVLPAGTTRSCVHFEAGTT